MRGLRVASDHDHQRERVCLHAEFPGAVLERRGQISLNQPAHTVIDVAGVVNLGQDEGRLEPVDVPPNSHFKRVAPLHRRPAVHRPRLSGIIDPISRSNRDQRTADAFADILDG